VAPDDVHHLWELVLRHRDTPLRVLREGRQMDVCEALITLHAMADEACRALAAPVPGAPVTPFERTAWELLDGGGSFSRIDPARIRITPKTHFASRGISIRSFSRYLALNYEAVETSWSRRDLPDRRGASPQRRRPDGPEPRAPGRPPDRRLGPLPAVQAPPVVPRRDAAPAPLVLSLTALGMVARSRPPGLPRSRAVAVWSEPGSAVRSIELARGACGIVITLSVDAKTAWTADGRRHDRSTPAIRQIALGATGGKTYGELEEGDPQAATASPAARRADRGSVAVVVGRRGDA
jgi:hypothetical protein